MTIQLTTDPELLQISNVNPKCYSYLNERMLGIFRVLKINSTEPVYLIQSSYSGIIDNNLYFTNLDLENVTEEQCFLIFCKFNPKALYDLVYSTLRNQKRNAYLEGQENIRSSLQKLLFGDTEW